MIRPEVIWQRPSCGPLVMLHTLSDFGSRRLRGVRRSSESPSNPANVLVSPSRTRKITWESAYLSAENIKGTHFPMERRDDEARADWKASGNWNYRIRLARRNCENKKVSLWTDQSLIDIMARGIEQQYMRDNQLKVVVVVDFWLRIWPWRKDHFFVWQGFA